MDLTTKYLGLSLRSPLVPSASPLSEKIDNIRAMNKRARQQWFFIRCSKSKSKPLRRNFA